jgi:hypothetical protein
MLRDVCPALMTSNGSGFAPPLPALRGRDFYLSERYNFGLMRHVGKVAGTALLHGLLIPTLCSQFYSKVRRGGCQPWLARQGYLRGARDLVEVTALRFIFTVIRDPYARAVSLYKFMCEERATIAGWISFELMLCGAGGPAAQIPKHYPGYRDGGFWAVHWEPQAPFLLALCRLTGQGIQGAARARALVRAIRIEPNVVDGLDAVIDEVNRGPYRTLSRPGPQALQKPSDFVSQLVASGGGDQMGESSSSGGGGTSVNTEQKGSHRGIGTGTGGGASTSTANALNYGGCPWQCYFQLCGEKCMRAMLDHYHLDVFALGYSMPTAVDDLWHGERVGPTSTLATRTIATAAFNRSVACLLACPLLRPGAPTSRSFFNTRS